LIINFSVDNFLSFDKNVTMSMVAGRERKHANRIPKIPSHSLRILPIAAIFGGNASGKSNLFKALAFCKRMVVDPVDPLEPIQVRPFSLNAERARKPSSFSLIFLIGREIYKFSISVNARIVVEERLVKIKPYSETILYRRAKDRISFDPKLSDIDRLSSIFKKTAQNQPFLNNFGSHNHDAFQPAYGWFKNSLNIIGPDSALTSSVPFTEGERKNRLDTMLACLDTGIDHLGKRPVKIEDLGLPQDVRLAALNDLREGETLLLPSGPHGWPILLARHGNEVRAEKLTACHSGPNGEEIPFDLEMESEGTKRLIKLLPVFLELGTQQSMKIHVIDEIDTSLHSMLVKNLIDNYLDTCSHKSRNQLLFTTHNTLLIDRQILRHDEMWVTERDAIGATTVMSFGDYKDIAEDKDICKNYLFGRYGGIPILVNGDLSLKEGD
jgi:AAA15 family ATPase/GTPase